MHVFAASSQVCYGSLLNFIRLNQVLSSGPSMHLPQARECNSERWMLLIFLCILRFLLHDYYFCLFLAVNLQMIESVVKVK